MIVIRWLGITVSGIIATVAAFAAIVTLSPFAVVISLLALILLFVIVGATRPRQIAPAVAMAPDASPRPAYSQGRSDQEKLRRSAAHLGVDLPVEKELSVDLNDRAAKDALRDIVRRAKSH